MIKSNEFTMVSEDCHHHLVTRLAVSVNQMHDLRSPRTETGSQSHQLLRRIKTFLRERGLCHGSHGYVGGGGRGE